MKKLTKIIDRTPSNPAYITHKIRQQLAPFVLFDAGRVVGQEDLFVGWHPHSGVATVTLPYDAKLVHQDSMGNQDTIEDQGLQWMASGKGIWHKESYQGTNTKTDIGIMQLWILLPPNEEIANTRYFNLKNKDIVQFENTRILLGSYQGNKASHTISQDVSYLDVNLKAGESWHFQHPSQTRGFIYPRSGQLRIGEDILNTESLGLLEESKDPLEVIAMTDTQFVLAVSSPWPHKVVHQYGQMHTNLLALEIASNEIQSQAKQLQKSGLL